MGILKKFFGGSKEATQKLDGAVDVIEETLEGVIDLSGLDLAFDIFESEEDGLTVELTGEDEPLLKDRDGQLLDAFQFFMKRTLQHQFPDLKVALTFDSNGFREEANKALIELADRLKNIVLEKKKSVYFRALPPKDRKTVHQYLAEDGRVKSRSVGDGLYKKIKIFPAGMEKEGRGGSRRQPSNP